MTNINVCGTFDTKPKELHFVVECLQRCGVSTVTIDVSLQDRPSEADISSREVASRHPDGAEAIFESDRPEAIRAMGEALRRFLLEGRDAEPLLAVCGSTGASIVSPAMRSLRIGTPKLMVSPVVSGDVAEYVGTADVTLMHSVADFAGLNWITRMVLANAAHAIAGMASWRPPEWHDQRVNVGITSLGVTSRCSLAVIDKLDADYECISFPATPAGGSAARELIKQGGLGGFLDITLSDVGRAVVQGQVPESAIQGSEKRLAAIADAGTPYLTCCGGLDFTIWRGNLPSDHAKRSRLSHTPAVTLLRTSPQECQQIGHFIGEEVNRMSGPVLLLLPQGGLSALDVPGGPFHDPEATDALFSALESRFRQTDHHRLERVPHAINDEAFAEMVVHEATGMIRSWPKKPTQQM